MFLITFGYYALWTVYLLGVLVHGYILSMAMKELRGSIDLLPLFIIINGNFNARCIAALVLSILVLSWPISLPLFIINSYFNTKD